ncbi:MAG: carboxylate-amine ligase [Proteobacteria bacterium]|nr:carboxylate-amine ligase [Pseudomonadota bacterium]
MTFRFGIEEEFFVVEDERCELALEADETFFTRAKQLSEGRVKCELLQSQIEAVTSICDNFEVARTQLRELRAALAQASAETGLSVIASGTHPTAKWTTQLKSKEVRYDSVVAELQMLAQRNLVCGLHVHVELPDPDLQISVMRRTLPFLPILLALSTSSPFWQARQTGFSGYRMTSYEEMPRAGLPPRFDSHAQYQDYVATLLNAGVIPDASYIWWSIRPSSKFPTLELRIADACTSVDDALTIAALYRCLVRRLSQDRALNSGLTSIQRAFAAENKWRAQRFGINADLINPFDDQPSALSCSEAASRLVELLRQDACSLGCLPEIERVSDILEAGTSADAQVGIYDQAIAAGASDQEALQCVLAWLKNETLTGCVQTNSRAQLKCA